MLSDQLNHHPIFLRKQKGIHYSIDQNQESEQEGNSFNLRSNFPDTEERMIMKQREKMLQGYISKLKPHYQILIDYRYFKEYSYEETAKALDLPIGTVKVQLFRARNQLFNLIQASDVKD